MRYLNRSLLATAVSLCAVTLAQGQATRTWVSGVGDDANPCSRTAPCKTFAGAISKTAAGGEIDALDPGGFGTVTITKAMTIDGGGTFASVLATSSTVGVNVAAGLNDVVILRNLSIQGASSGSTGIRFTTGKALHIDHCKVMGFVGDGIDLQPTTAGASVYVTDTASINNGGNGLRAIGPNTFMQTTLDSSHFDGNLNGVNALDYTRFSIRNSSASGNSQAGFIARPAAGMSVVSMVNTTSGNNSIGIQSGGGAATASVRVSQVSLFLNASGFVIGSNGAVVSFGNNYNSGSGMPTSTLAQQ